MDLVPVHATPARIKFWFDLLFAFPFDGVIHAAMAGSADEKESLYIGIIRFLKLVRCFVALID